MGQFEKLHYEEAESQPSCLGAVMPSFIYLVTNETDRTVESCFYNSADAIKECDDWSKSKPQKHFMVVELEIN